MTVMEKAVPVTGTIHGYDLSLEQSLYWSRLDRPRTHRSHSVWRDRNYWMVKGSQACTRWNPTWISQSAAQR